MHFLHNLITQKINKKQNIAQTFFYQNENKFKELKFHSKLNFDEIRLMVGKYGKNLEKMSLDDLEQAKNMIEKELYLTMKE